MQRDTHQNSTGDVLDHVMLYLGRTWAVTHVPYRKKVPDGGEAWHLKAIRDAETAKSKFNGDGRHNVGVLMECGLSDADLDCPEALTIAGYFLPETRCMFGRASTRMSHRIYRSNAADIIDNAVLQFKDPEPPKGPDGKRGKAMLLELRVGGGGKAAQTVFPGSVHESGEPIEFERGFDDEPAETDGKELIQACRETAAACLVARAWPAEGGHDPALTVGGFLARCGWDTPRVGLFLEAVMTHVGGVNAKKHVQSARDAAEAHANGKNAFGYPALAGFLGEKRAKKVAEWLGYDARAERDAETTQTQTQGQTQGRAPRREATFQPTEDSIALEFAARHADDLRYCHDWGQWLRWDGNRWQRERTRLAFHFARGLAREANIGGAPGPAKASTAAGAERFAQADPLLATLNEDWDADNWLLGTPGGTVDLRTGILRPAARSDRITKVTAVAPAPSGAPTPLWDAFLKEATGDDEDLIAYLQRLTGYALTGDVSEHALGFFYGDGGNGKGVYLNTITHIWGDYSVVASMDVFTASKSDRHPTDLAFLRGARLVTAQETEEGRAWNDVRIKAMTGGDPITARYMRQDFFTFLPTFKILIAGNHKPTIRTVDDAMRRRFNILPFTNKPEKPDKDLPEKLKAEWPGILRKCIDGCLDWQKTRLSPPEIVRATTNEYFEEQDVLARWLDECCEVDPNYAETQKALFKSWKNWAESCGEAAGSAKDFTQRMLKARRGFARLKNTPGHHGARGLKGVRLAPVDTSNQWQNDHDR